MQLSFSWKRMGIHVTFWLLLGILWYYLRYQDYSTTWRALQVTIVKVVDLAILIYITNYVLIPQLLYRKRHFLFFMLLIAMILCSSWIKMQLIGWIVDNPSLFTISATTWKARFYDNVIPHFFLVTAGAAVKLIYDYTQLQKRMVEVAREKAETELAFLKSQINPHFLFNSLNAVYFLIDKKNSEARRALHTFSDMLRYQLYETNEKKISIEKEVAYLKDYVTVQQLRKNNNLVVNFTVMPSVKGFSIEPLLLIPFVENAFKHCTVATDKTAYIRIVMQYVAPYFTFSIVNAVDENPATEGKSGIGVANVKRRLQLLYPGKHELIMHQSAQDYKAELKLNID